AVVEKLDAVDAADEGLLAGGAGELVRREDVRDVSEDELAARDLGLEERILLEHRRAGRDVTLDVEEVHDAAAARLRARRGELPAGIEELSLGAPVGGRAGRTGDALVERADDPADRGDVRVPTLHAHASRIFAMRWKVSHHRVVAGTPRAF